MKRSCSVIIASILVLLAIIVCGCNPKGESYNLYFSNKDNNNLVIEKRIINSKGLDDLVEEVVQELLKGPSDSMNNPVFSKDAKLLGIEIVDGIANVKFNGAYYPKGENANTIELLARYSLVNTLCEIEGIDKIKIFIDGVELTNSMDVPVGALGKEDVLLNSTIPADTSEADITLYFPDKDAINLFPEQRTVNVIDNNLEKTIVLELIKGPKDENLFSTIPVKTNVLSVETNNGICNVNLSESFVKDHAEGSATENFTIYSIVNSLTELENVDSVQFLIEGEKNRMLKHITFDAPFPRSEAYIGQ